MKLKLLFVTEYYPPHIGGVETFFYELRQGLVKAGHQVDVVTTSQPGAAREESDSGGTIYRVPVPRFCDRYAFSVLAAPLVLKLARDADVIHSTTYNAMPPAWLAAKIRGKKSLLSVHEVLGSDWAHVMPGSPLKARFFALFEAALLKLDFDRYVCVSEATRKDLPERLRTRASVIHHGIDSQFKARKGRAPKNAPFVFYGRMAEQKGLWFLLRSLPYFYADKSVTVRFKLVLSGSTRERARVARFLREHKLDKFVKVRASLPYSKLPNLIHQARAVVIPSFSEGFGFTAAESCACKVPVIVSDAGSLPEVVSGKHLVFKAGDSDSLLAALNKAVKGQWNMAPSKRFTWGKAVKAFEALYKDLS